MKQLSILLKGEFNDIEYLFNEIEDIGHHVALNQTADQNYDYIIFADIKEFKLHVTTKFAGQHVVIDGNKLLLLKNTNKAYLLYSSTDNSVLDADMLVNSITLLSRGEFASLKVVPFVCDGEILATECSLRIDTWNDTKVVYPQHKTLVQLFEEQVQKTPNSTALVYADIKLSYMELNERANQLAHYLRTFYQIQGDDLVALCLNRSEYMLIAILGVLKAGGAYVPLDPSYPDEQISYVLEDTHTRVLLTNEVHKDRLNKLVDPRLPVKEFF